MADTVRRTWGLSLGGNDLVQSKRSLKSRTLSKDDFYRSIKSRMSPRSKDKKTTPKQDVSDPMRPKSESSTRVHSRNDDTSDHSTDNLQRSTSAPTPMMARHDEMFESLIESNEHISFVKDNVLANGAEKSPSLGNLPGSDVAAHITPSDPLPAAMEDLPTRQFLINQANADEESGRQIDTTDSGSAPTQIIEFSDDGSENLLPEPAQFIGPTITKTFSQVLETLREVYGPSYQQTDDIAGIHSPQCTERIMEYLSPRDMSILLSSISAKPNDETSRISKGCITPWLAVSMLYSETLRKADSLVDKKTGLTRSYVSSWIFMSLAMSRVDGLRFIFTVYLSFWIYGIDVASISLAQVAMDTEQEWFKDTSNISLEERDRKKTVPYSRCRTGSRTDRKSANSSKVAAVISGPDQIRNQTLLSETDPTPANLKSLTLPRTIDEIMSDDASVEETTEDDETQHPASRAGVQLNPEQATSSDTQKEWDSKLVEASLKKPGSDAVFENRRRSMSSSSSSPPEVREARRPQHHSEPLLCKNPTCERTFTNESELDIHMDIRHDNDDQPDDTKTPVIFLSLNDSGYLTQDDSVVSVDDNRSRADERRRKERSRPLRQVLRLDGAFRVRSGKEAREFFVRGRVFAVLWHENSSPSSSIMMDTSTDPPANLSMDSYGQLTISRIRRFVVVKAGQSSCVALPIDKHVFDGNRTDEQIRSKAEQNGHTIIYDKHVSSEETSHGTLITKEAISVEMAPGETLDPKSRVNFDTPQTFEWETKVKDIGMVDGERSLRNLLLHFNTALRRSLEGEPLTNGKSSEQKAYVDPEPRSSDESYRIRSIFQLRPSTSW